MHSNNEVILNLILRVFCFLLKSSSRLFDRFHQNDKNTF